jgi:hypothetical protein
MSMLPPGFETLEPFAGWCLPTETERNAKRLASSFAEITSFAEAFLPHIERVTAHLDAQGAVDGLSAPDLRLYHMLLSLAEVAPAIESYEPQAAVIDGYESARFAPDETHRLRPKL